MLRDLTAALRAVMRCDKTYVALFAEAEGFEHLHVHVIPRQADLSPEFRGPRIFGLMGGEPARQVPETVMDQIAVNVAQALAARH